MRTKSLLAALAARMRSLAASTRTVLERCAPAARRAASYVARVAGGSDDGWATGSITRHVAVAGVLAALLAAAEGAAGPAAPLVEIAAGILIAGVAVSAVASRVRHHHGTRVRRRQVVAAAADRTRARHGELLATKALACACGVVVRNEAPLTSARPLALHVARASLRKLVVSPVSGAVPGLGGVMHVLGAFRTVVQSAAFIRDVEAEASTLCLEISPA